MRTPVTLHPCKHSVLSVLWVLAILLGVLVSVKALSPFSVRLFVFLLLNFESSLNILDNSPLSEDFPGGTSGKESACQCRRHEGCGFSP